ncbi:MAG: hypothetical protein JWM68_2922, partial [Verrucomicrobiales bacterium]|nr:hypothetical protein [Verrucomicrobiales bacterium]
MIPHQAIGMHLPPRLLAGLAQGFEEILSIDIVVINVLPSV